MCVYSTELGALFIIQYPVLPVLIASLAAALVSSLAIYVVSWCYQYTLEEFEIAVNASALGKKVEQRLIVWLGKVANPWPQLLTSIVATAIVIPTIYAIQHNVGLPFDANIATFIALGIVTCCMGQGGYWAIVTPIMTRELKECKPSEIGIHSLYPNNTPILVAVSKVLSVFALWDTVMVTLCLVGLFALRPDFNSGGILYIAGLVLVGYLVSSWTFLYTHINLAQVIRRAKENTLFQIQCQVNQLYCEVGQLGEVDLDRLQALTELHGIVSEAPNTAVSLSGLRSFFGSFLVPAITALIGLLDWSIISQKLLSLLS
jgi:hypothetical protein